MVKKELKERREYFGGLYEMLLRKRNQHLFFLRTLIDYSSLLRSKEDVTLVLFLHVCKRKDIVLSGASSMLQNMELFSVVEGLSFLHIKMKQSMQRGFIRKLNMIRKVVIRAFQQH